MNPRKTPRLAWLASPSAAVVFFVMTAAAVLAVSVWGWLPTAAVSVPLLLMALSLGAAILIHPRLRADLALLLFHMALLAFIVLLAVARLSYFEGRVSLAAGESFAGEVESSEHGPWFSRQRIAGLWFANAGLLEDRASYGRYVATHHQIRWRDAQGLVQTSEIGDDRPLWLNGVRIYTTHNRGFAPVFYWQPVDAPPEYGRVQLRDMGEGGFTPDGGWLLPHGPEMWAMIVSPEPSTSVSPLRKDLNADHLADRLLVRIGDGRYPLRIGQSIEIPEGKLTYVELRPWIGYRLRYDPMEFWLLAVLGTALLALAGFYVRQFWGADGRRARVQANKLKEQES